LIYLPNTNAVSVYLRGSDEVLTARMQAEFASLRLSALVVAEREYGIVRHAAGLRYRARFEQLVADLPVELFTREDAAQYARIRATLEKRGRSIGPIDTLIAAQALRLDATIVTRNTREFERVPGLKCENWQGGQTETTRAESP
jgi:tRNA(fMet)-specific endonuclease VapC